MSTEGASATSFTSITTYLSWDHERLDRALAVASDDAGVRAAEVGQLKRGHPDAGDEPVVGAPSRSGPGS